MVTPQTNDSPNFLILILMVLLLKVLFDFKSMGGFNYPFIYDCDNFSDDSHTSSGRNKKSRKANKDRRLF